MVTLNEHHPAVIIRTNCWRSYGSVTVHDDVIKWKHFPRYWPFVRGIHRSPVNFPHKGQWRGALMFSLICVWINGWVNNREAGDLRRHRGPLWRHRNVCVLCGYNCSFKWTFTVCRTADPDMKNIDGLMQDCSISSMLEMEIMQSCTKPSIYSLDLYKQVWELHVEWLVCW